MITDVRGIKLLDGLKTLKMFDNPLTNCTELHMMSRKHFKFLFSQPEKATDEEHQPTAAFY